MRKLSGEGRARRRTVKRYMCRKVIWDQVEKVGRRPSSGVYEVSFFLFFLIALCLEKGLYIDRAFFFFLPVRITKYSKEVDLSGKVVV